MFLVISSMKLEQFWWNLVDRFVNKFSTKDENVFHLAWIMAIHYLVKRSVQCSSRTCYHWVVKKRNSRIYLTLTVASKFASFKFSWLQRVGNTAREGVQNTHHWSERNERGAFHIFITMLAIDCNCCVDCLFQDDEMKMYWFKVRSKID